MAKRLPAPYRHAVEGLATEIAAFLGFLLLTTALSLLFAALA